jgi:hypothetical protein
MSQHPRLLASRQYLTLDLLEGLCARAREIAGEAFEQGEHLSNEELFRRVMLDMACRSDELVDLQNMFEGGKGATTSLYSGALTETPMRHGRLSAVPA